MSDTDIVRAVATLITQEARRQNRGWDYQGIWAVVRTTIDEDGRTPREIITAGYSAVDDKTAQTPGAIRWPKWYTSGAYPPVTPLEPRCATCCRTRPGHDQAEAKLPIDQRHPFAPKDVR